jgi:hypothetical protein
MLCSYGGEVDGTAPATPKPTSRRTLLAIVVGVALLLLATVAVRIMLLEKILWTEDFLPGNPPDIILDPMAWNTTDESITFAVLGDNGSGGRNAMAVGSQMARTYQETPYGLVLLAGDISYYGSIDDRWEQVFVEPYGPLIDAGITWELAIGNHELEEQRSETAAAEIEAKLRRFGKPNTFYTASHGPMDVFILDSSTPAATGEKAEEQLAWLEDALAASDATWKVALLHHPPYSSGKHGSALDVRAAVEPLFIAGGVDIVFTGHDHHYERTVPQHGIVYVVSGAGCKLSDVGWSDFTAHAESTLQFMLVRIDGDVMSVQAVGTDGRIIDRFQITSREGT